jgi:hypothetical protein
MPYAFSPLLDNSVSRTDDMYPIGATGEKITYPRNADQYHFTR